MDTTEKDFLKKACPSCNKVGSIRMDPISVTFRCISCGRTNIDPYEKGNSTAQKSKEVPTIEMDPRPTIPDGTPKEHIVKDYYLQRFPDGSKRKVLVSQTYCPTNYIKMNENEVWTFDPNTKEAKYALHVYAAKFKNRRRYRRDLHKRTLSESN